MNYSNIKIRKNELAINIITIIILILPFLSQYSSGIPGVSLGDIFIGLIILIGLIKSKFTIRIEKTKWLLYILILGIITTIVSLFIQMSFSFDVIIRYIRFSFYIISITISTQFIDKDRAVKYLRIITYILSIYIIIQTIFYYIGGIILPFKFLWGEWMSGSQVDSNYILEISNKYYFRAHGFFMEPGFAAQYLLIGLTFSLYNWNNKKNNIGSNVLILLAILFTKSSQGIFIGVIIIAYKILSKKDDYRNKLIKKIFIFSGFLVLVILIFNTDAVKISLEKLFNTTGGSSTSLRLYRGFAVFNNIPFIFKILGVGHGNVGKFVIDNNIHTKFDPEVLDINYAEYVNGISSIILYYGIFVFIIFIISLYKINRYLYNEYRLLLLVQILIAFVAGAFFDSSIITMFSLILMGINKDIKTSGG